MIYWLQHHGLHQPDWKYCPDCSESWVSLLITMGCVMCSLHLCNILTLCAFARAVPFPWWALPHSSVCQNQTPFFTIQVKCRCLCGDSALQVGRTSSLLRASAVFHWLLWWDAAFPASRPNHCVQSSSPVHWAGFLSSLPLSEDLADVEPSRCALNSCICRRTTAQIPGEVQPPPSSAMCSFLWIRMTDKLRRADASLLQSEGKRLWCTGLFLGGFPRFLTDSYRWSAGCCAECQRACSCPQVRSAQERQPADQPVGTWHSQQPLSVAF